MIKLNSYTTDKIISAVNLDTHMDKDEKERELAKTIISEDAYAICDLINSLISAMERTRR